MDEKGGQAFENAATWLDMGGEEYFGLVLRAMNDPWEPWDFPPHFSTRSAMHESHAVRSSDDSPWLHRVVKCERMLTDKDACPPSTSECYINVHMLRLKEPTAAHAVNKV